MNFIKRTLYAATFFALANSAHAITINFADMANRVDTSLGAYGESAYQPLNLSTSLFDVSITGTYNNGNDMGYAYLDAGTGGLGVCQSLQSGATTGARNSGSNICSDSADDNVTTGEALHFVFNKDVTIETIWFNKNHDFDYSLLGDNVDIDGSPYIFTNGGWKKSSYTTTPFYIKAGTSFDVAFASINGDQFYVEKMHIVPEPASLSLIGVGLLVFGFTIRRRRTKK